MIASVTRSLGVRVRNRFTELECSDSDDEDEEEEELECKVCMEDEHAVMYGEDQGVKEKRVTINEDARVRYINEEEWFVEERDKDLDLEKKLSKEIDEFVTSIDELGKEIDICEVRKMGRLELRLTVELRSR